MFDDGPGKTVYSYERMKVDLAGNQVVWNSGTGKPSRHEYKITSSAFQEGTSKLTFESTEDARTDEYSFEVSKKNWLLTKYEASGATEKLLRSKYEFTKREA